MGRRKLRKYNSLVDIVIPVYGRFDLFEECLASIPDDKQYNLIIVDNNSPEQELADSFYKSIDRSQEVDIIRNHTNFGFAAACNQGADRRRSPLIFFLNTDVILEQDAIDYLVREMDDPTVGICGMLLVYPEYAKGLPQNDQVRPAGKVQHVGIHMNIHGVPTHSFMNWSVDNPKVKAQRLVWGVTGAAMMVRRSVWHKAKGFDEEYGLGGYEDIDLCMATRELGYNIVVSQLAKGVHYTNASVMAYPVSYPMAINQIKFMNKWMGKFFWNGWQVW